MNFSNKDNRKLGVTKFKSVTTIESEKENVMKAIRGKPVGNAVLVGNVLKRR